MVWASASRITSVVKLSRMSLRPTVGPLAARRGPTRRRGLARSLEAGKVLGRMVRGPRQRARRHKQEAPRLSGGAQLREPLRRHEAMNSGVLARRLQILADGEEVDLASSQIV